MVISSEFGMVHHRDDGHREDGPHFICKQGILEIYCACKTADWAQKQHTREGDSVVGDIVMLAT